MPENTRAPELQADETSPLLGDINNATTTDNGGDITECITRNAENNVKDSPLPQELTLAKLVVIMLAVWVRNIIHPMAESPFLVGINSLLFP